MLVREPILVHKAVDLVLNKLAYNYAMTFETNRICVGAFTIRIYMDIIVDILSYEQNLFARYISIPQGDRL